MPSVHTLWRCDIAYAFDALTDLVNQQGQSTAGQQSIFNPTLAGTPGVQGSSAPSQGGANVKTDASADIGNGTGSNISGGPSSSSYNFSAARPDMSAYAANAAKAAPPQSFADMQSQISTNQQNLQNTADQYVSQGKAAQQYGVSNDTLNQAVKGDASSQGQVKGLLNQSNPNAVAQWQAPNLNVPDVNMLSSDAGLRQLISRGQGPSYTPGMQSFDMTMLRASPGFQNLIQQIQGSYADTQKQANDYSLSKPQDVLNYGGSQLQGAQTAARGSLQDMQQNILNAEQKAAEQTNANLTDFQKTGAQAQEAAAAQAARDQLTRDWQASNSRAVRFIPQATVDPSQYASFVNPYTASQMVTPDQALQFNNIMSLLNQSGSQKAALPLGNPLSMDNTGMYNSLATQAGGLRSAADTADQAERAQILKAAQDYASQVNTTANAPIMDKGALALSMGQSAVPDIAANLVPYYKPGLIDPGQYISYNPSNLSAEQVLNKDQANRLNYLGNDLGLQQNPYAAWNGSADPSYNFNKFGYEYALNQALNKLVPPPVNKKIEPDIVYPQVDHTKDIPPSSLLPIDSQDIIFPSHDVSSSTGTSSSPSGGTSSSSDDQRPTDGNTQSGTTGDKHKLPLGKALQDLIHGTGNTVKRWL